MEDSNKSCKGDKSLKFRLLVCLFLTSNLLFSQSEIKLYAGIPWDFPGIAYEYTFSSDVSFEIGTSYFFSDSFDASWRGSEVTHRSNSHFVNLRLKKNRFNEGGGNFYWGGYIRYWRVASKILNVSQETLNNMPVAVNSSYRVTSKEKQYKISMGVLMGIGQQLNGSFLGFEHSFLEKLVISLTAGIGFSPSFLFWKEEYHYNYPTIVTLVGDDDWLGSVNHLSILAEFGLAYRF